MQIVKTTDFHKKPTDKINDILQEGNQWEQNYILVANEKKVDNSYLIVNPNFLVQLLNSIGLSNRGNVIVKAVESVRKKTSEYYRNKNPYYNKGGK